MEKSAAYTIVDRFEKKIASWSGARYGVAVSSCCNAIFLCLKYLDRPCTVIIPKHTYPGVAMAIVNAGYLLEFDDKEWSGSYRLDPLPIEDSALRLSKGMYMTSTFRCLSFHYKKHLPIGRGGMILTDDIIAYEWLKQARFDGRREGIPLDEDNAFIIGWNMYMTPEQAARGLALFEAGKNRGFPDLKVEDQHYPDLSKWKCFSTK